MTRAEIIRWARAKKWPDTVALFEDLSAPLDRRQPAYAECQGIMDPFCGRCRFSSHGCAGAPSRAAFAALGTYF